MPKKTTPKQKPRPSKEVLEMVKAAREKTANKRKRDDVGQTAIRHTCMGAEAYRERTSKLLSTFAGKGFSDAAQYHQLSGRNG